MNITNEELTNYFEDVTEDAKLALKNVLGNFKDGSPKVATHISHQVGPELLSQLITINEIVDDDEPPYAYSSRLGNYASRFGEEDDEGVQYLMDDNFDEDTMRIYKVSPELSNKITDFYNEKLGIQADRLFKKATYQAETDTDNKVLARYWYIASEPIDSSNVKSVINYSLLGGKYAQTQAVDYFLSQVELQKYCYFAVNQNGKYVKSTISGSIKETMQKANSYAFALALQSKPESDMQQAISFAADYIKDIKKVPENKLDYILVDMDYVA